MCHKQMYSVLKIWFIVIICVFIVLALINAHFPTNSCYLVIRLVSTEPGLFTVKRVYKYINKPSSVSGVLTSGTSICADNKAPDQPSHPRRLT